MPTAIITMEAGVVTESERMRSPAGGGRGAMQPVERTDGRAHRVGVA